MDRKKQIANALLAAATLTALTASASGVRDKPVTPQMSNVETIKTVLNKQLKKSEKTKSKEKKSQQKKKD